MKQVKLELNGSWVLEHRGDTKLPVDVFVENVCAEFGESAKVTRSSLTECEILLVDSEMSCEDIDSKIKEILYTKLNIEKESNVATCSVNIVEDNICDREFDNKKSTADQENQQIHSEVDTKGETLRDKIDSLIGAEEFKTLVEEITSIAPRIVEHNTVEAFAFQDYLFAINDGCGLSTYLTLFSELLTDTKLFTFNERQPLIEAKLLPPGRDDPFGPIRSQLRGYDKNAGRLICVDISEWMSNLSDKRFKNFLTELEDRTIENIIVFRVPFVEQDVLDDIAEALQDILYIRTVAFSPMSNDELIECGRRALLKYKYSADEGAWNVFEERIAEEKSDGRFYGINTVNKIIREMIYRKQLSDVRNDVNNTEIKAADIIGLTKSSAKESGCAMSLTDMIGMEEIQKSVDEIVTQIELSRQNKSLGNPCLHMRFVGNPGTGKTTVARLIGRILKDRGVLRNGNFFEYSGRDLCGRYIGETAPKTAGICRDAYGSVLFIDEAYSLYRGENDNKDYGREALDTLIAEMENHRKDLVVIMAGYSDEMEQLMTGNIGLESRMPYIIEFPNYTREQLSQIYLNMVGDNVEYSDDLCDAVKDYFNAISDEVLSSKTFSNARFVRNLFERTCAKAGIRKKMEKADKLVLTKEDFLLASSERSFERLLEKKTKNRIGF